MTVQSELHHTFVHFVPSAGSPLCALGRLLLAWQGRAQDRARLALADERELVDMGLTRAQAAREVAKPFWRA